MQSNRLGWESFAITLDRNFSTLKERQRALRSSFSRRILETHNSLDGLPGTSCSRERIIRILRGNVIYLVPMTSQPFCLYFGFESVISSG